MIIHLLTILFTFGLRVGAHSQLFCTDLPNETNCKGFPRYFHFNYLPDPLPSSDSEHTFYALRDGQFQLQPGVDRICPEMTLAEYTTDFPMARGRPGETLRLQHPPRGHASQPSSKVWIYMLPEPNVYPGNLQPDRSKFELIAEYPFDDCRGLEEEVSWANCTGALTLPSNLENGVYTFWWRWDLNGIPYSDCFEVDVRSHAKCPRSQGP